MAQKERDKWGKVLVAETMSSKESDEENEEIIISLGVQRKCLVYFTALTARWKSLSPLKRNGSGSNGLKAATILFAPGLLDHPFPTGLLLYSSN